MEQTIVTLIGNVGFPIAVAVYLLVRVESTIKDLTTAINSLTTMVTQNNNQPK